MVWNEITKSECGQMKACETALSHTSEFVTMSSQGQMTKMTREWQRNCEEEVKDVGKDSFKVEQRLRDYVKNVWKAFEEL